MSELPRPLAGVFFDLDGTLADSAHDLHDALATVCREQGLGVPPFASVRGTVSRGARAVLGSALGADQAAIEALLPRFLEAYVATGMRRTRAFDGIDALLASLESRRVPWGVVSNKAGSLVAMTLRKLGYADRAAAIVAGDSLPQRKPDPAPVLHACRLAGAAPARSVFVGDDPRDIQAGLAAGLYTVAAGWGYLDGTDPRDWQADAVVADAAELAARLDPAHG